MNPLLTVSFCTASAEKGTASAHHHHRLEVVPHGGVAEHGGGQVREPALEDAPGAVDQAGGAAPKEAGGRRRSESVSTTPLSKAALAAMPNRQRSLVAAARSWSCSGSSATAATAGAAAGAGRWTRRRRIPPTSWSSP